MDFDDAVEFIMHKIELGYVDDPDDPGGETKWGITKRSFPDINIKDLTPGQAKAIYRKHYWDMVRADEWPKVLRMPLFDSAVNQGPRAATELMQKALRVKDDGIIGPITLETAEMHPRPNAVLKRFMTERALRYICHTVNYSKYGRGWLNRLFIVSHRNGQADGL